MPRIIEAGHYYLAHGPTEWTKKGWEILQMIRQTGDKTMLFLDDVHGLEDVHEDERRLPVISFSPRAHFKVMESETREDALKTLNILKGLSKRKKATKKRNGMWFCSGFPVTDTHGNPLCVLLDLGLCFKKHEMGFTQGINILPHYYASQQQQVLRLLLKALPEFSLTVVLFDWKKKHWEMVPE